MFAVGGAQQGRNLSFVLACNIFHEMCILSLFSFPFSLVCFKFGF